jgi:hypothetical protein
VRVLTEVGGGTNDDIAVVQSQGPIRKFSRHKKRMWGYSHSINTGLDSNTGIVHVAADVSENL